MSLQNKRSRLLRQVGLATLSMALITHGAAHAQDVEALEARIEALEAMLADLRDEVSAARDSQAAQTDRVIEIERQVAAAPAAAPAARSGDGFQVGNTTFKMAGFVDIDYHVTDVSDGDIAPTSIARDFYIPGATPVGGSGDDSPDTDFTAKGSRIAFTSETPTSSGTPITGRVELDFLGSPGGDERVSNSYNPRLRLAWINYGGWRVGQDWTTFQNTSAIPESASFLVASDGMIFVRQMQVRYTHGNWQFALENPDTTVTPYGGGGRIDAGDGAMPDVVARYNHSGSFGNVSFAALVRNLAYQNGAVDGNTTAWGLSASGKIKIGDDSDVRFTLSGGEGIGRYIGLNAINGAVVTASGDLEAIPVWGGLIALRQSMGEGRRINVGYSHLEADNDITLTGTGVTKRVYSAFGNYMVTLQPGLTLGGEVLFGERELENGQSGTLTRFTISTKYAF